MNGILDPTTATLQLTLGRRYAGADTLPRLASIDYLMVANHCPPGINYVPSWMV